MRFFMNRIKGGMRKNKVSLPDSGPVVNPANATSEIYGLCAIEDFVRQMSAVVGAKDLSLGFIVFVGL